MNKSTRGSAYIMAVFVSLPILLILFALLAASANSRNSLRHGSAAMLHEIASSANVLAIAAFEEAYKYVRHAAHMGVLSQYFDFTQMPIPNKLALPVSYTSTFREQITPLIQTRLKEHFVLQGAILRHPFNLQVGETGYSGVTTISFLDDRVYFETVVKHNPPSRSTAVVRGRLVWQEGPVLEILLDENFCFKNLDYFTPWVVELIRR